MPLAFVFRVFAAILGLLGALNVIALVLADPIARYSPVEVRAMGSLSEALLLFGVGAGIYLLGVGAGPRKAHH
ncbi:MAG: hypothetical protein Q7J28_17655 [Caulobacter sp.]|nr:hypothetical protein [Caulobacter sp.]